MWILPRGIGVSPGCSSIQRSWIRGCNMGRGGGRRHGGLRAQSDTNLPPHTLASVPIPMTANRSLGCSWHLPNAPCPWAFPQGKAARGVSKKYHLVQLDHQPLGTFLPPPSLMSPGSPGQGTLRHPWVGWYAVTWSVRAWCEADEGVHPETTASGNGAAVTLTAKNRLLPSPLAFGSPPPWWTDPGSLPGTATPTLPDSGTSLVQTPRASWTGL